MKIRDLLDKLDSINETTTAGAMAPVAQPLGKTRKRKGIYGESDEPQMYQDRGPTPNNWTDEQWAEFPQPHTKEWIEWKVKQHAASGEPLELVNASWSRGNLSIGDLRDFGWVTKEYDANRHTGDIDDIFWHLSEDLPFPIIVRGKTYYPGDTVS